MNLKSIHTASIALLLTGCATNPGVKTFRSLDSDHDGKVTDNEFANHINSQSFRLLDQNADGAVSSAEWNSKETESTSLALFKAMDADRNGSLSSAEFSAAPGTRKRREIDAVFHTLDRDHDGGLTWSEISGS